MNGHAKELYANLVNAHEVENYRQDALWLIEVEGFSQAHLIRGVVLPHLVAKPDRKLPGRLYPQNSEYAKFVFNLSNITNIEKELAAWMTSVPCAAAVNGALYMLKAMPESEDVELASSWKIANMKPVSMQLQNFQRKSEVGITELLVEFSFDHITID